MPDENILWSDPWFLAQLEKIRSEIGIENDKMLATLFGVSKSSISMIKSGSMKMPISMKFSVLDRLGYLKTRAGIAAAVALVSPETAENMTENLNEIVKNELIKKQNR